MSLSMARIVPQPTQNEDRARVRNAVANARMFSSLPLPAVEDLASRASIHQFGAGNIILNQDDPGDSLFIIHSGRVEVVVFGVNGREVTLALLRAGNAFGEISLFDGSARSANVIALEPTTALRITRDAIMLHLAKYPTTAVKLLEEMATRLRKADHSITQLALCDVNERLVWQLAALAREEGTQAPEGLLVRRRPTQQELANMIGSCRETISRAFNQLARDGLVIARGRSMIVTPALMAQVAEPANS